MIFIEQGRKKLHILEYANILTRLIPYFFR
jgi:hypothetical protein